MKDEDLLRKVSKPAAQADIPAVDDLLETLIAHRDGCVGLAANMITCRPIFFLVFTI